MSTYPKTPSLNRQFVHLYMSDVGTAGGTAGSAFFTPGYRGKIKKISTCIPTAIATTNTIVTASIGTVAVTNGAVTIPFTSSAAGDIATATPTALEKFGPTDYIKLVSDGATSTTLPVMITLELEMT
jgi:hypothetical protein